MREWLDDFYNARCDKDSVIGGWTRTYPEDCHQVIVAGGCVTVADLFDVPDDVNIWWQPCPDEGPEKVFDDMEIVVEHDDGFYHYYIKGEDLEDNIGAKLNLDDRQCTIKPK